MENTENTSLAVFILNWNQPGNTIGCVQSLLAQSGDIACDLFIIDNGSTDDSIDLFREKLPGIEVIENGRNLGFQGGMNVGVKRALAGGYEFVMLLNDDTIAAPDMLAKLFQHMPADAHLVSPGIYYLDDPEYLCSLGNNFNPLLLESLQPHKSSYEIPGMDVMKFDFLPAHAWLIRTSVFTEIGLIDEAYFPLYYDDLDFCLRMLRANMNLYLIVSAKLFHKVSMSMGGQNSPKERYFMARNSGYYFRKHMKSWNVPFVLAFRFASAVLWTFRLIAQRNPESVKGYLRGLKDGWLGNLPG